MRKRFIFTLVMVSLTLLGSVAIGRVVIARGQAAATCQATPASGVFMGVADPNAPYDLRFIDEMVMHHRGAIMSAQMMIADSPHPELRDLARRIETVQQQQVDQMLAWRSQWYPGAATPAMSMDPTAMMSGDGMMGGMMNGGMMGGGMMRGDMADRMFLRMMIPHHQLAIDMAEDALTHAQHPQLKHLARTIISGQSAEITEMEGYLHAWYGEDSTRDRAGAMREMMQTMLGQC